MLAYKIEQTLSKDEILEIYMNQIWLGGRTYGFALPPRSATGKELSELDLGEMALLIGLPKNPAGYNPHASAAPRSAAVVPGAPGGRGQITQEQADAARRRRTCAAWAGSAASPTMRWSRCAPRWWRATAPRPERGLQVTTTPTPPSRRPPSRRCAMPSSTSSAVSPTGARKAASSCSAEGYDDELDRAFAQRPDLGELRTAVRCAAGQRRQRRAGAERRASS